MDARVVQLHLWAILVLLSAKQKWIDAADIYTNTWAVQISGGPEEADRIAREHGFINHGNVSSTSSILCVCRNACVHFQTILIIPCEMVSLHIYTSQEDINVTNL